MKADATKNTSFDPVTLKLTFESQNELDLFATIFNCAPICDALSEVGLPDHELIRGVLVRLGADANKHTLRVAEALVITPFISSKILEAVKP